MPWFWQHKALPFDQEAAFTRIEALLQQAFIQSTPVNATATPQVEELLTVMANVQQLLAVHQTQSEAQAEALRQALLALQQTIQQPLPARELTAAIHQALDRAYDMLRDRGEFAAFAPHYLPADSSGVFVVPLDPLYQYQLLFANLLIPEETATWLLIPQSYSEVVELSSLPNGIRRRAFNIHVLKAPLQFAETLFNLQQKLWPTMYLVEHRQDAQKQITTTYWRCSRKAYLRTNSHRPDHLCLYFDYWQEGNSLIATVTPQTPEGEAPSA